MTLTPLTFLFTDLEGSSALWEQHPEAMRPALARHDALLNAAVEDHRGRVVKTTGDGLHAVFEAASDGIAAALAGQLALTEEDWPAETGPLRVRMGLHTGESQARAGDYYGPAVNRAARIMAAAYGGQALLSNATAALVGEALPEGASLLDLGEHSLRDLALPEQLYQLCHSGLISEFPPLKSLAAYPHNLPLQLTSFVGREKELAEVKRLLEQTRLLTLLGPGGTGKTRLALQAAADLLESYPDGAWFVDLAPLTDPERLPDRVAAALNVSAPPERPVLEVLTTYLRRKELLFLLDNVEHLVQASAELAEHLLLNCPSIRLLVTGRESLFIAGETTLQIPSLSLPKESETTPEAAAGSEALQLFLARARAVQPDFRLTTENAPALVEVVRRLDGIPLALELAAARLRMMSVEQIAVRLNDRFRLLTGGRRTALPRQQTLQALIDWSWNLLEEDERVLLRRLSVFSGGWTLEAAQAVAAGEDLDEYAVFDCLEQLINKSLVVVERRSGGEDRYRLLESIRQYALERLFEAGEGEVLRDRHAEYYVRFEATAGRGLIGRDMLAWIDRVFDEADNTRAAREWALETRFDLALRMAGVPQMVLRYSYSNMEGKRWLEQVIAQARDLPAAEQDPDHRGGLAKAVIALGTVTNFTGESAKARRYLEEGIAMADRAGVDEYRVFGLSMLQLTLFNLEEFDRGRAVAEEALALCRQHGLDFLYVMTLGTYLPVFALPGEHDQELDYTEETLLRMTQELGNPWSSARVYFYKGLRQKFLEDWAGAEASFLRAAELFEAVRDLGFAIIALSEAGHTRRWRGDYAGAEAIYRRTILTLQENGHRAGVAHQLECFGMMAAAGGEPARAAKLLGAAQALREAIHSDRQQAEQEEYEEALAQLGETLGETERDHLAAEGRLLDADEAVALALA